MANGWNVVVVRNDGDGTKCENAPTATARSDFRYLREVVYARRGLKRYGLRWIATRNPLTGIRRFQLVVNVASPIVADARDAGLMSYCCITVDGNDVRPRFKEEEFAGHGGLPMCLLRGTQHVLALIEERAAAAQHALEESELP